MHKSDDKLIKVPPTELPPVDYTKGLPQEVKEALEKTEYTVIKDANLSWDGRQFIVRIPSEITREYGITKENRKDFKVHFELKKPEPKSNKKPELYMEIR